MSVPPDHRLDLAPGRPALDWADGGPRSTAFGDVYFSVEDGWAETQAVFLAGCGLPEGWGGAASYTIGELGFGTGLNALVTLDVWRKSAPPGAWLHWVSIEGFPLAPDQAARALAPFAPKSPEVARALLAAWPPRIKGVHRRRLDAFRATLTLAWLDVETAFDALEFVADAWFLDGFAPAKNPQMWTEATLNRVAQRSAPGARAASFTVAGGVRRALEAAGFAVGRRPGFGRKRERLEARLTAPPPPASRPAMTPRGRPVAGPIAVIGAGLAGAAIAAALSARGREGVVYDAALEPASAASGNPVGLVMPRLDLDDRPAARLHRAAYAFAVDAYRAQAAFVTTGVVELAKTDVEAERFARLAASGALPEDACGLIAPPFASPALTARRFDPAGVVRPKRVVAAGLANVELRLGRAVAGIEPSASGWRLVDETGALLGEAGGVVVAAGAGLSGLDQTRALTLRASRGQITRFEGGAGLDHALIYGGYAVPDPEGLGVWCGATYAPWDPAQPTPTAAADDAANRALLHAWAPALSPTLGRANAARAAVRATTPDRLPYAGPAVDAAAFETLFAGLKTGAAAPEIAAPLVPGLWVLGGLGSRGLVWAPLLAEAIASEICGEPGAIEAGAAAAIHPARVFIRALKRGRSG